MNNPFENQVSGENSDTVRDARISGLAKRALLLGEQLGLVHWDSRVYDSIKLCVDELAEAAESCNSSLISEHIRDVRSLLTGVEPGLEETDNSRLSALTGALQQIRALAVDLNNTESSGGVLMQDGKMLIALLGEKQALDEYTCWLERAGLEVVHTRLPEDLPGLFDRHQPVALVVDLSAYEDESGMLDLIAPILKNSVRVNRLVYISRRADQEIRLRAIQTGGDAFLTKPVTAHLLVQHLELALLAHRHDYTVMLIGDSSSMGSRIVPAMEKAGMTVKCLNNASQALLSVINSSPDLLIIEQSLTDCSGCDLGRVIHQLADYEDIPVIYTGDIQEQVHGYRPDYPAEWVNPDVLSDEAFILMIDRLVCASKLRINRLRQLQSIDPVTGLLNRQGFYHFLERMIPDDSHVALVLIEFEDLQHGYPQVPPQLINRFLAMISRRLERLLPYPGQSGHISDYSFACLVSGKSYDEIRKLGQLLCHSLSSNIFEIDQFSLMVVCSIGIATSSSTPADGMSLLSLAMNACDEARLAGNNRVSVRSTEVAPVIGMVNEGQDILELVRDALGSDRLRLVYQPIASLRGTAVEKYEVLLRLSSATAGTVPPSVFIPVAEENGLMESMDRWVVGHTIQTLLRHGCSSCFFVKVSSGTLRDAGFIPFLRESLARYGAAGERLVFEISASSISKGMRYVAEFTRHVGMLGCGVSIEHGDVSQDVAPILEHLHASYVKLNRDALKGVADDPQAQAHLKFIIDHAEQKGAMTIAGFVEDADCLQLLWQSGIHYIQGYFLQEPDESLDFEFALEGTAHEKFPA